MVVAILALVMALDAKGQVAALKKELSELKKSAGRE